MQFPVPQFTDVEDHIIGPLTLKQFGIVFGVGAMIFLAYSATKSVVVLVFFFLLLGVPGLSVAFAKINGRPMYNSFGFLIKYLTSPKELIFHKEARNLQISAQLKDVEIKNKAETAVQIQASDPLARLREVNSLLAKQAAEETKLSQDIKG